MLSVLQFWQFVFVVKNNMEEKRTVFFIFTL
jgi:hypothetical protein